MSEKADEVAISSGEDVPLGDSSQPQQQEITSQPQHQEITVDHPPPMSIDELLKVIKGANGMPVLFVPSSDGRLAAVAVDGLQNLLPSNHNCKESSEKNQQSFRAWLLLLASLAATITFTAGLAPPGGFWDSNSDGHHAGTPVMRDIFYLRYFLFYYSNTTAFFTSLMVIAMLAKNKEITVVNNKVFGILVGVCYLSLGGSYVAGMSVSVRQLIYAIALFSIISVYMTLQWILDTVASIRRGNPARGQLIAANS